MEEHIIARVFRFNPATDAEPKFQDYKLPYSAGATVLGALRYIHENLDPTLAFRDYHCGALICGCCQVTINGKRGKSCCAVIRPGETVVIEPFDRDRVIRDLAVKFD